jgi:hypothetical protein
MPASKETRMADETLGYVELEWVCKHCQTRNGGTQKVCSKCGAAMGERDQYHAPADQRLMTGEAALAAAQGAPDIHCHFCGAGNTAGAAACVQCGADLTQGRARAAGADLGQLRTGPAPDIVCPYCRTPNPAAAKVCKGCNASLPSAQAAPGGFPGAPGAMGVAPGAAKKKSSAASIALACIALVVVGVVVLLVMAFRTKDSSAVVQSVAWERTIAISEQKPSQKSDWADQIPSGAQRGSCSKKVRKTQSEPAPDAEKVCEKPKMVDQGNGTAKVVQSCKYNIYDNFCEYTVLEWKDVDKAVAKGNDLSPKWPEARLRAGQREGKRSEDYKVFFKGDGEQYTYSTDKASEFSGFSAGSKWVLKVNTFGTVNEVAPAK